MENHGQARTHQGPEPLEDPNPFEIQGQTQERQGTPALWGSLKTEEKKDPNQWRITDKHRHTKDPSHWKATSPLRVKDKPRKARNPSPLKIIENQRKERSQPKENHGQARKHKGPQPLEDPKPFETLGQTKKAKEPQPFEDH